MHTTIYLHISFNYLITLIQTWNLEAIIYIPFYCHADFLCLNSRKCSFFLYIILYQFCLCTISNNHIFISSNTILLIIATVAQIQSLPEANRIKGTNHIIYMLELYSSAIVDININTRLKRTIIPVSNRVSFILLLKL